MLKSLGMAVETWDQNSPLPALGMCNCKLYVASLEEFSRASKTILIINNCSANINERSNKGITHLFGLW